MKTIAALIILLSALHLSAAPLSLANDRINFYANIPGTQGANSLLWDGGRNGLFPGESAFIEARNPSQMRSLYLDYSLTGDIIHITWRFDTSAQSLPTFPLTLQSPTLSIGDIDWRNSGGGIQEQGVVAAQILTGGWQITSLQGSGLNFTYTGGDISSLNDLAFTAQLFNSTTVPEPSTIALLIFGGLSVSYLRKRKSSSAP